MLNDIITKNMLLVKDQFFGLWKKVVGLSLSRSSYFRRLDGLSPSTTLAVYGVKFFDNSFGLLCLDRNSVTEKLKPLIFID